ncbi:MAG: sensor histidine kinase KdpD [Ruminococcaceae bacterium]|nr:sensor histidine kinase KdpD [Oscillospiraceae bacterium]
MHETEARDHVLVCLSSAPSNERLVACAAEMARASGGTLTALYVQTPETPLAKEQNRAQLENNIHLAEDAGARVETVFGEDIADQIAEFVRLNRVTRIVIGGGAPHGFHAVISRKQSVTDRLAALIPERDIYIIPERKNQTTAYPRARKLSLKTPGLQDILICIATMSAATLIGLLFRSLGFAVSTIISVYLLGVLMTAVLVQNYMSGAFVSLLSVITFNFFFTEPQYSLLAYEQDYPVTFVVMFLVSIVACYLAEKLKSTARQFSRTSFRTKVLFDTSQMLYQAETREQIFETTAKQLVKLLERDVLVFPAAENGAPEGGLLYPSDGAPAAAPESEAADAAEWVLQNGRGAGSGTALFSFCGYALFPVGIRDTVYGVVGVAAQGKALDAFDSSLIISILGECALTLENEKIGREKAEAAARIRNEQFRSNLLRSISHDLRTPLTAISGNASNLLSDDPAFDGNTRQKLYQDIYDDSIWLTNLVENLLSLSRIEEGGVRIKTEVELLDDIIDEALRHIDRHGAEHTILAEPSGELLLVRADARLIVQVIINLVNNAVKYTPPGSSIRIKTEKKDGKAFVSVADDGPGIPAEEQERVFDMFYSGAKRSPDSRRGVGMGLALCRSIVLAHDGNIILRDNESHGAVFTFSLPLSEVKLHE